MFMIIAIIYIFLSLRYLINSGKLLSENPQPPPEKIHYPSFLLTPPTKIQKVQVPPFLPTLNIFQPLPSPPPAESGGGHCVTCHLPRTTYKLR